ALGARRIGAKLLAMRHDRAIFRPPYGDGYRYLLALLGIAATTSSGVSALLSKRALRRRAVLASRISASSSFICRTMRAVLSSGVSLWAIAVALTVVFASLAIIEFP
ncbi:hypothetical protein, partial [Yoonia sp.]|uniref:hypothetical protein n=1 Tax=Yoonia sp. TaxID=2212373 RepID=UPI0023A70A15